jgi:hypothetical protein
MLERRKQQRLPAYWTGRISYNRTESLAECLIRNTSGDGAKLVLNGATFLPREFDLNIPKHRADYRAKVIWRRSEEVGIAFERVQSGDAPSDRHGDALLAEARRLQILRQELPARQISESLTPMALVRRLKKLQQENASLRRRLLMQTD